MVYHIEMQEISKLSGILVNLLASYQLPSQDVMPFVRDTDKVVLQGKLLFFSLVGVVKLEICFVLHASNRWRRFCLPFGQGVPLQHWKP